MTIALILSECRGLCRCNLQATHGEWKPYDITDASNAALCNLTVGLVGFGGIARKLAKRLVNGFGSRVLSYDPYLPDELIKKYGVEPVKMDELLAQSDIVSLHVALTDDTKNLFGMKQFLQMKPTAIFVNTARGKLVKEDELYEALKKNVIRSAALDVYCQEPLQPDSRLYTLKNITLTPHMSGLTTDIVPNTLQIALGELLRYVRGEALCNRVN